MIGVDTGIVDMHGGSGITESSGPVSPDPKAPGFKAYTYVEQFPEFGSNLSAWVTSQMRYPPAALDKGIEGRVVVKFIVQPDGCVTDATIERGGFWPDLDAETLRIINAMPKWKTPGRQGGKAVPVYFMFPVKFQLPE